MQVDPTNVEGRKVETHEFSHSVEHQVNWSHVLGFFVALCIIVYLAPSLLEAVRGRNDENR